MYIIQYTISTLKFFFLKYSALFISLTGISLSNEVIKQVQTLIISYFIKSLTLFHCKNSNFLTFVKEYVHICIVSTRDETIRSSHDTIRIDTK